MRLQTISRDGKIYEQGEQRVQTFLLCEERGICQYENFISMEKIQQNSTPNNQIKISNRLCKQNGEFMEKSTVIKFNNLSITIKDRYKFITEPQRNTDTKQHKRVNIFKKPLHIDSKSDRKRRVTKNLSKNFIKAFLNYLQSLKEQKTSQLVQCKMKLLTSRQRYNNSFIQKIINDTNLQPYFQDFLTHYARKWIEHSKIRDKDIHYQAIEIFKKLTQNKGEKKQDNALLFDQYLQSFEEESHRMEASKEGIESDKESIIANSSKNQNEEEL